MSISLRIKQIAQKVYQTVLSMINFVATPVARIFKPTEHHYPATGVQPYGGDANHSNKQQ